MVTIIARNLQDGSRSYRATIRIMRGNTVLDRERATRPPQMQGAWVPMPDRLLARCDGIDVVERKGYFD